MQVLKTNPCKTYAENCQSPKQAGMCASLSDDANNETRNLAMLKTQLSQTARKDSIKKLLRIWLNKSYKSYSVNSLITLGTPCVSPPACLLAHKTGQKRRSKNRTVVFPESRDQSPQRRGGETWRDSSGSCRSPSREIAARLWELPKACIGACDSCLDE